MTTETQQKLTADTPEVADATKRMLLEALRSGHGGAPLLRALLTRAQLPPDQAEVIQLLLDLEHGDPAASEESEDDGLEASPATEHDVAARTRRARRDAERELADLRQANDTMAAALGACPVCWGGDRTCDVCRGRGRPGSVAPDLDLYEELIAPAVGRVAALRRRGTRPLRPSRQPV